MQSNRTKNSDDKGKRKRRGRDSNYSTISLKHDTSCPRLGSMWSLKGRGGGGERDKKREGERGCRKLFLLWGQQYDWLEKLPMRRNNGRTPSPSSKFPGWALKGVGGFTEFKVADCSIVGMPSLSERRTFVYYQIRAASHYFL